ncbi:unnamed protein product [Tilletia controversa]|nr:unnamed protein product [Tilletia controversa]
MSVINVVFTGPETLHSLTRYLQLLSSGLLQPLAEEKGTVTDANKAAEIVTQVKTFVNLAKQRNNALIGKFGLMSLFFYHQSAYQSLKGMEASGDCLFVQLQAYVPSKASELKALAEEWSQSTGDAIKAYSS